MSDSISKYIKDLTHFDPDFRYIIYNNFDKIFSQFKNQKLYF